MVARSVVSAVSVMHVVSGRVKLRTAFRPLEIHHPPSLQRVPFRQLRTGDRYIEDGEENVALSADLLLKPFETVVPNLFFITRWM